MTAADPSHNQGQTNEKFVTPTSATSYIRIPHPNKSIKLLPWFWTNHHKPQTNTQKTHIKRKWTGLLKKWAVHGQWLSNVPMKLQKQMTTRIEKKMGTPIFLCSCLAPSFGIPPVINGSMVNLRRTDHRWTCHNWNLGFLALISVFQGSCFVQYSTTSSFLSPQWFRAKFWNFVVVTPNFCEIYSVRLGGSLLNFWAAPAPAPLK